MLSALRAWLINKNGPTEYWVKLDALESSGDDRMRSLVSLELESGVFRTAVRNCAGAFKRVCTGLFPGRGRNRFWLHIANVELPMSGQTQPLLSPFPLRLGRRRIHTPLANCVDSIRLDCQSSICIKVQVGQHRVNDQAPTQRIGVPYSAFC
jgi:hypothetical protein